MLRRVAGSLSAGCHGISFTCPPSSGVCCPRRGRGPCVLPVWHRSSSRHLGAAEMSTNWIPHHSPLTGSLVHWKVGVRGGEHQTKSGVSLLTNNFVQNPSRPSRVDASLPAWVQLHVVDGVSQRQPHSVTLMLSCREMGSSSLSWPRGELG